MNELADSMARIDTLLEELVIKTCDLMKFLGHKTLQCVECKEETDINVLMKTGGFCSACKTLKETEEASQI